MSNCIRPRRVLSLLFALSLPNIVSAQSVQLLRTAADARQLRAEMTVAVLDGTETADAAIIRLGKVRAASVLEVDSGPDLAFSYADVGQRLLAKDHGADGIKFFKAAEATLAELVKTTPDTNAAQKANYLLRIAFIRGNYLGEVGQAKLDFDQAISLQPEDKNIQRIKAWIGNSNGSVFKDRLSEQKKDK